MASHAARRGDDAAEARRPLIGFIDILRGLVELIVQGVVAFHMRQEQVGGSPKAGRAPRVEAARRPERLDRLGSWLRFRGVSGRVDGKEPRL